MWWVNISINCAFTVTVAAVSLRLTDSLVGLRALAAAIAVLQRSMSSSAAGSPTCSNNREKQRQRER